MRLLTKEEEYQRDFHYTMSWREPIRMLFSALKMIPANATWEQNGTTLVSGLGKPESIIFVDDQTFLIAEFDNHSIVQYNKNGMGRLIVAGGNGNGTRLDQLKLPISVVIDQENDSLVICDHGNQRVVRWSRRNNTRQGEILLDNIACSGLALDEQRNMYVSDINKHEVRKYQLDDKNGTVVAGGNGRGSGLNQLQHPIYLFLDREQSVYVSDNNNHRVMKWDRNATEGIVVAGGRGVGTFLNQSANPDGLFVDNDGTIYVVENHNHRLARWSQGVQQGTQIVGGNYAGTGANQLNHPFGLAFDPEGNLYVADTNNGRIQRFSIQ